MAKPIDLYSPSRHFFKVFFPDQSSNQLRIPTCFREHIEAESGRKISLKGPSGSIWKVSLVDNSNNLFFQDGWKEFVSDQSLDSGDFLVFRYNGNSGLSVLVFDKTACEKEKAFTARRSGEECVGVGGSEVSIKQAIVEEETPIFPRKTRFRVSRREIDDLLPTKVRKNKKQYQSDTDGPELKKYNLRSSSKRAHVSPDFTTFATKKQKSHSESSFSGSSRSGLKQKVVKPEIIKKPKSKFQSSEVPTPGPQSNKKNTTKNPKKDCKLIRNENFYHERGDKIGYLKSQRRPITEEEVSRAHYNASSFRSKNPFALLVMQDAYVYSGFSVSLPVWFVSRHLPKKSTKMTIWDPNHRQWKVTYIPYVRRGILSGGWGQFSYANNLEKYDVCIFELIEKNHLQVHIFRAVDEIAPLLRCSCRCRKKPLYFSNNLIPNLNGVEFSCLSNL